MGKRLLWGVAYLVFLALVVAVVIRLMDQPPPPGVTVENFKRLHKGMTEEEVGVIFGRPADHSYYTADD
jgi:hypothetical protein